MVHSADSANKYEPQVILQFDNDVLADERFEKRVEQLLTHKTYMYWVVQMSN